MSIVIQHYGVFRRLGENTVVDIPLPATVTAIRTAMARVLGEEYLTLIEDSAFASETDILPDEYVIEQACNMSILPPVCGG